MSEREPFLRQLQDAFARSDTAFIAEHATDDVQWTIVGDYTLRGKEAFIEALRRMEADEPMEINVGTIITHGNRASVDGTVTMPDGKVYAFCDVYRFADFKNPKIEEMTSYVIEVEPESIED